MIFLFFYDGGVRFEFLIAEAILSFDSSTALSGNPTILKEWRPEEESTSTSIN